MTEAITSKTPYIERVQFIIGERNAGKSTQIRSMFQDIRMYTDRHIPTKRKLPDFTYLSQERGLYVRITSPHEYNETVDEFFDKTETKMEGQGWLRGNFICPLHPGPYKKITISTVELIQRFYDRFKPERIRVAFLNPDKGSNYFAPAKLEKMQDDLRGYVGEPIPRIECISIDARHKTGQGMLLADFFDFT